MTAGNDRAGELAAEPLIAVQAWPGAESSYWLNGTEQQPTVAVTVSARSGYGLPGPTDPPPAAAALAAQQAERYRLICSQLEDPSVEVSLLTTLDPSLMLPVTDGAKSLRRLAVAAQLFAEAAATARPPKLTGLATLGELMDCYGQLADRLARANADQPLNGLLTAGQPLAAGAGQLGPASVPADASTLAQVAARLGIPPERLLDDNRGLQLTAESTVVLPGTVTLPVAARNPYLTRDGDTLATLARRFGTSAREVVTGNADITGTLLAGIEVEVEVDTGTDASGEVVTASTRTLAGDSFRSVCSRLAEQDARVTLEKVADGLERPGAVLARDAVLSCPLAVLGGSRDSHTAGPLTGAEVQAEHGCLPVEFAAANAAVLGLLQPGVRLSAGGRTVSTAECDTLNAVLSRLTEDGSTPSIAELVEESAAVPLFRPGSRALLPPPPITLTAAPAEALELAVPAVALTATLRFERTGEAKPASGTDSFERADTTVSLLSADRNSFVDACLTVLPTVRLASDAQDDLWAVSFGSAGISSVRVEPSAGGALGPQVFALRPLYPDLLDFSASIRPVTAQGELDTPTTRRFHQLHVEPLARLFVTDLDRCLAEPLSSRLPDTARDSLLAVRRQVSEAIANGLAQLRQGSPDSPPATEALANARGALASISRQSLARAYLSTVVAQYRAVVVSPYAADGQAARLVATVQAPGRTDLSLSTSRTELDPSNATCTFALTSADPSCATSVSLAPQQVFEALEINSPQLGESGTEPVLLRFLRALAGSNRPEAILAQLPPADLPIPLREYPDLVWAPAMTAVPTFAGPGQPTLAEAAQWTSGLSYTHQHAAQDVVQLWTSPPFPATTIARTTEAAGNTALAEALAGYAAASAELTALIGSDLPPADADADADADAVRGNAAASLVALATAVATAWSGHWSDRSAAAADPADLRAIPNYQLRAVYSTDAIAEGSSRWLDRLVVSRTGIETGWPAITVVGNDEQLLLMPGPVTGQTREYAAPQRLAGTSPLSVRLDWAGLRGAPGPDARIWLTAERNLVLGAGIATSPAFVLTARPIQLEVTSPAVRWSEPLPLAGDGLSQALRNAFKDLFGAQPENIRLSIEAGYAEPTGGPFAVLPVLLKSGLVLAPDSADVIAAELEAWQRAYKPITAGAEWWLRVALLSAGDGEPPLLAFDRLVFPVPSS